MAPARWAEHQLMLRYVKDLTRRQVPIKRAHRRFRTVRAFARHLSPRSLLEAGHDDLSEWAASTAPDTVGQARLRSDIADFYEWCRVRTVLPLAQLGDGGQRRAVAGSPATVTEVDGEPAGDGDVAGLTPALPESEGPSLSRRLGVVLVLSAVGILWMAAAAMPDRLEEQREPPPTTTTAAPSSTEPTTTTTPVRPPADVSVMAVNASGLRGRAAAVSETLRAASYAVVAPQSASRPQPTSSVYWTPGYENEARAVATALGLPPTAARPVPGSQAAVDLKGANVVVVVGQDLSGPG